MKKNSKKPNPKLQEPQIIYEDNSLYVINKPSGWVVNDAQSTQNQSTIQSWIKQYNFPLSANQEYRDGIVHRLDKETSGILLIAKTVQVFENLQAQFKARKVYKTYVALLHGKVGERQQTINVPTGRLPWNRERFGVLPGGNSALTVLNVLEYYQKGSELFTLVKLNPKTGRTHQLRVHSKYIHHPIVADSFYAGRKTSRKDRVWCPRTFLHAQQIEFTHPATNKKVNFKAPLSADLQSALDSLGSPLH